MVSKPVRNAFQLAHATLKKGNFDFALTGGLAVAVWKLPRSTHDIDFVVASDQAEQEKVVAELLTAGFSKTSESFNFLTKTVR